MDNPYIVFDDQPKPAETPARGTVKPLLFIPLGRDVIRDSWVFNCLADIIGQGWPRIKTEANATDI
jgi:hypothetical protein